MRNGLPYFALERNLVSIVPLVGSRVRVVLSLLSSSKLTGIKPSSKLNGNPAAAFLLSRLAYPYIATIAMLLVTYVDQVSICPVHPVCCCWPYICDLHLYHTCIVLCIHPSVTTLSGPFLETFHGSLCRPLPLVQFLLPLPLSPLPPLFLRLPLLL